ncbi:asparagine synthase (glutamine-hydrolyzing) [Thalassorhabdus alkalitolerans]|uniref:asparagine synthase (glutamine-hydrolyzing) n=1 Tax=Thalassorhabdus alkalitolerans TaxID=2282697 RepID=A0ABW0YPL9_9BACI
MCGIAGWIHFSSDLHQEKEEMIKMIKTLRLRGPDEENIWSDRHALFGHTRLIVVDPAGGKQPMTKTAAGKTCTIIYNGELYNTEEVRKELLAKGYTFASSSDTEVLLTAFLEWKEQCVEKVNGIFAFAIWDHHKEELFLGRDRLGVKPLFFAEKNGGFLFASEIKAILAHREVKAALDEEGLLDIFGLGPSRTPGKGVFQGIQELRPAHVLRLSRTGKRISRYWNVKSADHKEDERDTALHIRQLLQDTVERQLIADVPVSTLLSGGIDSSALTAFAATHLAGEGKGKLHTFSIDYEDNSKHFKANEFQPASDKSFIELMSNQYSTIHHNKVIPVHTLADMLDDAVMARDLPGMADIDSSLLWFSKEIKKTATVALSGECADEIFGGYPWFYRTDLLQRKGFPWMDSLSERKKLLRKEWQEKLNVEEYSQDRYQETLKEVPAHEDDSKEEAKRREMFYLNMIWFMTTLLDRKDRMSMAASLEVRVPFADHRLVEYVWNIPWEMKRLNGMEKGILRKALEGILPHEVLYRKKSPYPKTHHPVYTNLVTQKVRDILADKHAPILEIVDRAELKKLADSKGASFTVPWFGQLMTGPQLLANMVQMNKWLEINHIDIISP